MALDMHLHTCPHLTERIMALDISVHTYPYLTEISADWRGL